MAENLLEQLRALLKQKKSNTYYAARLGITEDEVRELREELKQLKKEEKTTDEYINETMDFFTKKAEKQYRQAKEEFLNKYPIFSSTIQTITGEATKRPEIIGQDTNHETGDEIRTVQSTKPLSPKELEELAQVDGINTYVARTWLKSHKGGLWTYSIDIRYRINDFYTKDELKAKIEELIPDYTPNRTPKAVRDCSPMALFIYIADDHCGALNDNSIFGNDYSDTAYSRRLSQIVEEVERVGLKYERVYIVNLGDQLNGWNQQTTRGGHIVKSLSNKEQFDIYVTARKQFYDELFSLPITNEFILYSLENSNHSGLGFSYMADEALRYYVEAKYPRVSVQSTDLPIDCITYGQHVIAMTHGKDERQQKTPFPLNLNDRVDGYFYQYFDKKGFSAYNNYLHVIKGDLHQYGVNVGKSCRYVNVPSIAGPGDYSEINFCDGKPGALVEIVEKNSSNVLSLPLWFK